MASTAMSGGDTVRRTLAVVRCGDDSLHPGWARDCQTVDVAVSYFGNNPDRAFPEARYVHRLKAGKWDGIHDFFRANPDAVQHYDYFWFPDDDIAMTGAQVDALIALGNAQGLDLWQPALDRDSYYGHTMTLALPGYMLRYTNFVEIMAPVMSRRVLEDTLPLFGSTRSGFGLDYYWPQRVREMRGGATDGAAIIDAVTMTHTRPLGQVLRKVIASGGGRTTKEEYAELLQLVKDRNPLFRSFGMAIPRKRHYAARLPGGEIVPPYRLTGDVLRSFYGPGPARRHAIGKWLTCRYLGTAFF